MADFIRKKLQVFVSSTFSDLIKERQAAVEAILAGGHIPAGMELFTAGDESQMEVIKQWIDESDVYLLILGGRYGSIEPKSGKSYTHLEYDYALMQGKPLFACVIDEKAIDPRVKSEGRAAFEMENPQKLKDFRAEVLTKMSKFWEDSKDIKIAIAEKLSQLSKRDNLVGWVRSADQSNLPALADEIARLSKENAELRSKITGGEHINGLSFMDLKKMLEGLDLLEFFATNRKKLVVGTYEVPYHPNHKKYVELQSRGLVTIKSDLAYLTESGMNFLNRLEILEPSFFIQKSKTIMPV